MINIRAPDRDGHHVNVLSRPAQAEDDDATTPGDMHPLRWGHAAAAQSSMHTCLIDSLIPRSLEARFESEEKGGRRGVRAGERSLQRLKLRPHGLVLCIVRTVRARPGCGRSHRVRVSASASVAIQSSRLDALLRGTARGTIVASLRRNARGLSATDSPRNALAAKR